EEALVRRPSDFRLARTLANRHIGAVPRKWPEAAHYLSIALAIRPRNVYIQVSLAQVLRAQGKVEESKAALRRATRLEPSAARVHYLLGIAQANVFQMKEAAGEFREALRLRPDFLEAQYALARAASMSGTIVDAVSEWRKYLTMRPTDAWGHFYLADVLERGDDLDGAIAACRTAIRHKPDFYGAHNSLGIYLKR